MAPELRKDAVQPGIPLDTTIMSSCLDNNGRLAYPIL